MERVTAKSGAKERELDWRRLVGHSSSMSEMAAVMDSGRLHPVVLVEGREGIGKRHLALWMAARLLCRENVSENRPCGICGSCREVLAGIHPEVMVLDRGDASIKTADVDMLQNHFSMLSSDGLRIGVIMNADQMTLEACNRALKTLEEPPEQVRIFLTSSRPLGMPATVLGRCMRWKLKPPARGEVMEWMRKTLESHGRPPENERQMHIWAKRLGYSPGLILREIEDNVDHESGIFGDVRSLLTAVKASQVTQAAANLVRVHKAKVPELLRAVEWEINTINRHLVEELKQENLNNHAEVFGRITRRRLLRDVRRQAVLGKVTLNGQLVAESIGLSRWEDDSL